jgi:hypothetical protein
MAVYYDILDRKKKAERSEMNRSVFYDGQL